MGIFILFFLTQSVLSQGIELKNYVITPFGMEDGLPQSSVNDIIQTRDGYLWMATFGGLVRFDGYSFTTFNRANTPGMESDRLLKLFADRDGGIWLFPENEATVALRFKDGQCTKFSLGNRPAPSIVMYEDKRGTVWLIAFETVFRFTDEEFKKVPVSKNPALIERAKKDSLGVWMGFEDIILKTIADSVVQVYDSIPESISSSIIHVFDNAKEPEKLWVGTSMNGVFEINKEKNLLPISNYKLPYEHFLGFRTDSNNNIFGLTAHGMAILDNGNFKVFNPFAPEDNIRLKTILQDNEGNYWIGTEGNGLFKFRKTAISMIDKDQGLENEKMLSITKLKDGTLLLSTNCGGIFEWKNNKATLSAVHSFFNSSCNWSVFQDSKGRIWLGGANPYVTNSLNEPGVEFKSEDGYTGFTVFAMTEDSQGKIWIATANGIFIYDDHFTQKYTSADGLYYDHASALFEDEKGVMWVGTKSGLNTIQNNQVSRIKLITESPGNSKVAEPWVRAIYKDADGVMWLGTYGNGLFRLKNGTVTNITTQSGLFDDVVSHIVEDESGNFWMGSNRGISRVKRTELNDYSEGKIEEFHSYSYGVSDGMNSAETNGGFQPSTVTDSLGNIYFPTVEGVAVISTRDILSNEVPPPVYIENLRTSEENIPLSNEIVLSYDNPYLEIAYTAISLTEPKKVQFKYRMAGLDDTWIDVGNRRVALYSKIPPGTYTFQVIASNNAGVWNTTGDSIQIIVIPPFWQTAWFYGIVFFALLTSGPIIYYFRIKQLKKENEKQKRFTEQLIESQEKERRRIASELHDGLGQQILVIKNRAELAQDQVNNPAVMYEQLHEIMQSAVASIGDVRNISHDLRPVHLEKFGLTEAITNLCDQLRDTSTIEWSYHIDDIDGDIPKEKEINFYRVLQEGINNILKHSSAKHASVMVRRTEAAIKAVMWDDGIGFNAKMKTDLGRLGFLGMQERIETLGGTFEVQSTTGEGTVIKIDIPFQKI